MTPEIEIAYHRTYHDRDDRYRHNSNDEFTVDYYEALQLLQDQKNIEVALIESLRDVDPNSDTSKQLSLSMTRVRNHINRLYRCIPPHKRPATAESAIKAQEVFSTPELLENIQSYQTTRAKLRGMSVQRCWRDSVIGSVNLRRSLGLEPFDKNAKYFSSALTNKVDAGSWFSIWRADTTMRFPNWSLTFYHPGSRSGGHNSNYSHDDPDDEGPLPIDNTMGIEIISHDYRDSRVLGSRVRQMLICTGPALTRLDAHAFWDYYRYDGYYGQETVLDPCTSSSPRGFTIGELVDKLAEARKKLPEDQCDYEIKLTATLTLDLDDPLVVEALHYREECRQRAVEFKQWQEDRRQYELEEAKYLNQQHESGSEYQRADMGSEDEQEDMGAGDELEAMVDPYEQEESASGHEQEEVNAEAEQDETSRRLQQSRSQGAEYEREGADSSYE